ncbi:flagellar biosynthetic protein FliR [Brevundimonas sp.]|uniref:flagellar biosynthetic protein FliR n=1 Tax=Brevundimonas sp. TaxID=1871086 RepID=UPI002D57236F|nr:flagellar biosynthetic protein FliR [Brevundimonas sp.]HYC68883.1 flagellar biosynthetic protein FliR [Brevundimonas sp.]
MIAPTDSLTGWLIASLLISLRISPVLAFAPPFTLMRVPALFRVLLSLGLSGLMAAGLPGLTPPPAEAGALAAAAARELLLGATIVLAFQAAFGALYVAGRTVDIQAGFGLAALVDPTSRAQTPLVGSIYAYAAGVVFFAMGGHLDLLRIVAASLEAVPLGRATLPSDLGPLAAYLGTVFTLAFGVVGGLILVLFLTDIAIALLSRTAPQLNVLVLGFQVKTALLMIAMPLTLGVSGALLARMSSTVLQALPALMT